MTTRPNENQPTSEPSTAGSEGTDVTNDQLRDYARKQKDENTALRKELLGTHLEKIGLHADKELGKAIAMTYKGDMTADAVAAYAQSEFGYQASATSPEDAAASAQLAQQQVVDNLQSHSSPVVPTTRLDAIAAADLKLAQPDANRSDAQKGLSLKLEEYLETTR